MPAKAFTSTKPAVHHWILISLAALLVLILIGLVAWLVFLQQSKPVPMPEATRPTVEENDEPESTTAEATTETIQVMSPSTELTSIQVDLEATRIDPLTEAFAGIDATIEGGE